MPRIVSDLLFLSLLSTLVYHRTRLTNAVHYAATTVFGDASRKPIMVAVSTPSDQSGQMDFPVADRPCAPRSVLLPVLLALYLGQVIFGTCASSHTVTSL